MAGVCAFCGALQLTRPSVPRWALCWHRRDRVRVRLPDLGRVRQVDELVGILQTTVYRAVPITFGALSGVMCERSGVTNIAIEGMLLSGAFVAAVVGSITGNNWIGVLGAMATGALLAGVLAVLSIRYRVNQIIAGTVINIFAAGITAFVSTRVLADDKSLNIPPRFSPITVPVLSDIPIIGPVLFSGNFFVYALFVLIGLIHFALFYTRYGLRVRAVGEHPRPPTRWASTWSSRATGTSSWAASWRAWRGVLHGRIHRRVRARHDGRPRVIGLARHDLRRLDADRRLLASLVFGFADALQSRLSIPVPGALGVPADGPVHHDDRGRGGPGRTVRMPAADGVPYTKE